MWPCWSTTSLRATLTHIFKISLHTLRIHLVQHYQVGILIESDSVASGYLYSETENSKEVSTHLLDSTLWGQSFNQTSSQMYTNAISAVKDTPQFSQPQPPGRRSTTGEQVNRFKRFFHLFSMYSKWFLQVRRLS